MKYWVTSDFHLGHRNIIEYCNRPFRDINEMDTTIIKNFNEVVNPDDTVFFLGDFCFGNLDYYLKKFRGNIIFIKGNHDKRSKLKTIIKSLQIKYQNYYINMTHDPKDVNYDCDFNIVGHIHEKWTTQVIIDTNSYLLDKPKTLAINCGVDVWNFYPVELQELIRKFNNEKNLLGS